MSGHDRRAYGRRAERAARWRLFWRGYRILARNWSCDIGEVDIIARHRDELVFVEVKARTSEAVARPEDQVGPAKRRKLSRLLDIFLLQHPAWRQKVCRFDIVALVMDESGRVRRCEVLENAFPYVP
jgi:putative endonuclease